MQASAMDDDSMSEEVRGIMDDHHDGKVILIQRACKTNDKETLSTIIANDPKTLVILEKGSSTALHTATMWNSMECLCFLLDIPTIKVNARNAHRSTPLHIAAEQGFIGTTNVLLKAGADVNARDAEGFTPLHLAVRAGNQEAMHILLRSGANVHAVSNRLWKCSHLAAESGHLRILKDLYSLDESLLHAREIRGWLPIHFAAQDGHRDTLCELLEIDDDVNATTHELATPLHLCAQVTFSLHQLTMKNKS
eukprot:TRINITY_DN560_c0_g1_i2.p1 TRINITY_DN560_c0_g1~~TRINITY_DN560_c0_g1_i2.p1  ORF type:complete len:251 (-),score=54.09 TRINITY_DN560_c0_g1_i2:48-800(-)